MKVLLTGMTAQQANPASHARASNYAGFLREVLRAGGHEVEWRSPQIDLDTDDYDHVIVGVAPITALGANRTYGALSIIEQLWESDKLTLMVEAPEPAKIDSSLQAIMNKPENLTKPLFEYRKEYARASDPSTRERLLKAVSRLHLKTWPRTLVPMLPWMTEESLTNALPQGARGVARGGCLEVFVLDAFNHRGVRAPLQEHRWAFEPGHRRWLERQGVQWDVVEIPWSSRSEADSAAISTIRSCSGTLIAPQRTGTWWNTRYGMSTAQGVPVFTDWLETGSLGTAWSVLPMVYESLSDEERAFIAGKQYGEYLKAIKNKSDTVSTFETILTTT